jgi:N-acetylglucosaminylphosphatidylinositol deacetylase
MEELTVLLFAIFVACLLFYLVFSGVQSYQSVKELQGAKRVLIITSHPDDEVMFFGPTILGLVRRCEVFLLCMSPGREAGHTRKRELFESCRLLGIPDSNVILMRHTKLKDDPTVRWREELVSDIILRQVASLSIDTCVTFDRHGVSGHRNHISLYYALACLAMEDRERSVYCLTSVNLLRKYSGVVDVPMTFLVCPTVYLAGLAQWFQLQRAMMAHWSQYTWFRRLYMLFSRYTLINTLEPMSRPGGQEKKES